MPKFYRLPTLTAHIDGPAALDNAAAPNFITNTLGATMNNALLFAIVVGLASATLGSGQAEAARVCSQVNIPVCALKKDGSKQTYTNAGCAGIDGAKVLHKDACHWFACVPWRTPVCALDPVTKKPAKYASACSAEYYNAVLLGDRACKKG